MNQIMPAKVGDAFRRFADGVGDVFFPPTCVHCGALVEARRDDQTEFRHLCERCAALIDYVRPPHCSTCGHPFFGEVEGERTCPHCLGLHPAFVEGRTAVLFRGPVRSLVIELKYHGGLHVLKDVAAILRRSPHVLAFVRDTMLVPVPLHPRKQRERGYNQSELIAELLATEAGGNTGVFKSLRRVADTETQTAFDRRTRMRNLKNAFALAPGVTLNRDSPYIIVDDVFTTGSTLNSCARALRRAGALNLGVVTLGHG